eukprot:gb/GECH01000071.1/.p1 GENE.gb/GECH01000071.1/~~gb/GECH01000071.1/.p1  ORF type:complete len:182 (+),score=28.23 gb/GECH01000071.1/:1-546(+)
MRPLTDEETRTFFEKLARYIGRNITKLVDRQDATYVFRLHVNHVYYIREDIMQYAESVGYDELISLGTCFGKFTKGGRFRLKVTALDYLAQYAPYRIWLKPAAELSFLYGNHILRAGLGRITEETPAYQGVVVYNLSDTPLGFGVTARSTEECRKLEPTAVVCFHQADVGEYLREEDAAAF